MSTSPPATATLDDLYAVDGKAELIAGRIVKFMPNGHAPSKSAFEIAISLRTYASQVGHGNAYADGVGYALKAPLANGRQSFCPDASFYTGSFPRNRMRFIEGVPVLAVEVRSEEDYGEAAEERLAAKRADYFEAGTQVVWDADPLACTIAVYRSASAEQLDLFSVGQVADAEPALPGFSVPVDEIFV
jgi:Uma2 family endonuclease